MVNYSTGKVYKLHSLSHPELGIYIGSTTNSLSKRIVEHRAHFKRWQAGGRDFISSFPIFEGANDVVITLIEAVSCESRDQLLARERYWIETLDCVNRCIPGRTDAEYRASNRDSIRARQSEYWASNRDVLNAKQREKVTCECGCEINRSAIAQHRKTQKHLQLMSQQAQPTPAE